MKNLIALFCSFTIIGCASSFGVSPPDEDSGMGSNVDSGLSSNFQPDIQTDIEFWKIVDQVGNGNHNQDSGLTMDVDSGSLVVDASADDSGVDSSVGSEPDSSVVTSPGNGNSNSNGNGNGSNNGSNSINCVQFLNVWICDSKCE